MYYLYMYDTYFYVIFQSGAKHQTSDGVRDIPVLCASVLRADGIHHQGIEEEEV